METRTAIRMLLVAGLLAWASFAADVSGTWAFQVESDAGSGAPTFTFRQQGEKLSGTYKGLFGEAPLEGTVKGDKIAFHFTVNAQGETLKVEYEGLIESPAKMKGTAAFGQFGKATWAATKK